MKLIRVALAVLVVVFAIHCALATSGLITHAAPGSVACAFKGACRSGPAARWFRLGRSGADELHSVTIAVRLRADAEAVCDSLLMEISTPGSPKVGLRYTHEQVGELLSDFANTRKVEEWLRGHGISDFETAANGDFIRVTASISVLERLLHAEFHDFRSESAPGSSVIRRTAVIGLPQEVSPFFLFFLFFFVFIHIRKTAP